MLLAFLVVSCAVKREEKMLILCETMHNIHVSYCKRWARNAPYTESILIGLHLTGIHISVSMSHCFSALVPISKKKNTVLF